MKGNKLSDIVIIHGTGGTPESNWFPWLAKKLTVVGHNVYVPKFPTPENQSVDSWRAALASAVPTIDENTILIGHSCGATFMLHILESLNAPVAKSIFVSGFTEKLGNEFFDTLNKTFIEHDFDWKKVRDNMGAATLFHGDNDPYVPIAAAQKLSDALQTPLTIIPNGGHLNAEFGYTEFPEILKIL